MTSVTVDADDLEALVFAAAAIKPIEAALSAHNRDPFVQQHVGNTAALERLAAAARQAKRADADTVVRWDEPLTKVELKLLRRYAEDGITEITAKEKSPSAGAAMSTVDQLMCKGCVQIGTVVTGVIWSGASQVSDVVSSASFKVRVTARGHEKLREAADVAAIG